MKNYKKQSKNSEIKIHKGLTVYFLRKIKQYNPEKYKQIVFNMLFLRRFRKKHGPLHCVYCGRYIQICPLGKSIPISILATADHVLPKSLYPELAREESNLRPCCAKCNSKKGDKIWEEKFPYKEKENEQK